jgi:hypothetical protein
MNDYDRQLIGEASAFYVNDHDKTSENKADIDAYRYMLKQKGCTTPAETFTKEHLKNNSKSRERLQSTLIKSDLAYEQRGFISVSAFGFAACGIEVLLYLIIIRSVVKHSRHANGLGCS